MQVDMALFWRTLEELGDMDTVALATSLDDVVTIRPIGAVRYGDSLLIRTDANSQKAVQIAGNPNVAVCLGGYYLRARARILGRCDDTGNAEVQHATEVYRNRWPDAFSDADTFLSEHEVFIAITPVHVSQWVYEGSNIEGLFHLPLGESDDM